MPEFDFDGSIRWLRLDPRKTLRRRPDADLPMIGESAEAGGELLLDTCVYINGLQGNAPKTIADLLDVRQVNHSTVAIQELMHAVGVLDPAHPSTANAIKQIGITIKSMPAHRRAVPDIDVLGRAAALSGVLCRLQGYSGDFKLQALHDSILFLQAHKLGYTVLTGNVKDFDYLLQLVPTGRVLMYRTN